MMSSDELTIQPIGRRQWSVIWIFLLSLALLGASFPLSMVAVNQRWVEPPAFMFRFGDTEIAAPCPRHLSCTPRPPWYAVWLGTPTTNGGMNYEPIFFHYLAQHE